MTPTHLRLPCVLLLVLNAVTMAISMPARAQDRCADVLQKAEERFAVGEDDIVIGLLSGCINRSVLGDEGAVSGFRLLVQSHLRAGDERQATMALVQLLSINPLYEPDPDRDPRTYSAFVGEVKGVLQLPSAADSRCDHEMAAAQAHYDEGALDQTLVALNACLDKPEIDTAEAVRAHRMLALTHLRAGALGDARDAIVTLLDYAPDYEADPVNDIPAYTSLVGIIRQQLRDEMAP